MRRPILVEADLPKIGENIEGYFFDIKRTVNERDAFELSKDVAAFANAAGGTILVGAAEAETTGTLARFFPVPDADAQRLKESFSEAIRQRCTPSPVIDPVVIALRDGTGSLVAVNVSPYPTPAVSVWVRGDKSDGFGDRSYVFPVRVGTHTKFLTPDQANSMPSDIRRLTVILETIPEAERAVVDIRAFGAGTTSFSARLVEIRPLENCVVLAAISGSSEVKVPLPLDGIQTVFKGREHWTVMLRGTLHLSAGAFVFNARAV